MGSVYKETICSSGRKFFITKTRLFKYIEHFTKKKKKKKKKKKNRKFSDKTSNIFHISAQNIYCGHSLAH